MENLYTGARWIFRLNAYRIFIPFIIFLFVISGFLVAAEGKFFVPYNLIFLIIFALVVSEIYARMAYNRYLYEINNEGIKIEHGIIWKKYTSVPFERVQNVDIKRGIIARIIGFSTVDIETAGQAGFGSYGFKFQRRGYKNYKSEGHLPAIDINKAEEIRIFVMKKIKQKHKTQQGL